MGLVVGGVLTQVGEFVAELLQLFGGLVPGSDQISDAGGRVVLGRSEGGLGGSEFGTQTGEVGRDRGRLGASVVDLVAQVGDGGGVRGVLSGGSDLGRGELTSQTDLLGLRCCRSSGGLRAGLGQFRCQLGGAGVGGVQVGTGGA